MPDKVAAFKALISKVEQSGKTEDKDN